jgi:hypothetical protein
MDDVQIQVIELRGAGGLGVFLRVGDDQRLFRVAPVRDPNQPRFWCLAAFECSSCGIPVSGAAIWAGWWGSSQSQLPALLDTIKADAAVWLLEEQCANLRALLLQPRPPLNLPLARTARRDPDHHPERPEVVDAAERAS